MTAKRRIEIFSAGCPACDEAIATVRSVACPSCDVQVLDMRDPTIAEKAKQYGIERLPAIVVDGKLAACCSGSAVNEQTLRAAGVGIAN